ncbi:hypothetical protein BKA67DRAFT_567717 [Truncatella angustata]|uniref:Uncharacterized protein n=1 Tax=Truncatella angustata TaxID=152316 RepID=A0A9P8UIU1_9PEZI|nr:uncharacterized protein BKA67DRAFT_567717 [Truncatella angustata]KAH6652850.1 hypothetical protein BKA67DRAFT_567717 [Truncatella angustata]
MSSENNEKSRFVFTDEEDRAHISRSSTIPTYRVGDKVYLLLADGSREGPYLVASVRSAKHAP